MNLHLFLSLIVQLFAGARVICYTSRAFLAAADTQRVSVLYTLAVKALQQSTLKDAVLFRALL